MIKIDILKNTANAVVVFIRIPKKVSLPLQHHILPQKETQ